jgi:hypothetical protein
MAKWGFQSLTKLSAGLIMYSSSGRNKPGIPKLAPLNLSQAPDKCQSRERGESCLHTRCLASTGSELSGRITIRLRGFAVYALPTNQRGAVC